MGGCPRRRGQIGKNGSADCNQGRGLTPIAMAVLNPRQQRMLAKLADFILPSRSGGKQIYDIAGFVETFLSAFDQDPPAIYAGGPFSGRHPLPTDPSPTDNFSQFLPLTRYQRLTWQLRINGPDALAQE